MSDSSTEYLYNLLPAIYRLRDVAEGEPLRALLAVMDHERQAIEADIEALYDNWFIETCAEWLAPYLGDLLGVRGVHPIGGAPTHPRAYVANTLAYRRRKGTAAVLEQLARDVTGWPARVVEFFQRLATTQHVNHVRPGNVRTPNLRDTRSLELLGGPFEQAAHTVDVRRIANRRGRYNLFHVGLFVWRLQSYALTRSTARAVVTPADGRYTFNALGLDTPLFNRPQTETELTHLANEVNVPDRLRRRALYDELEARRRAALDGSAPQLVYFCTQPVFEIFREGEQTAIPPEQILICDLSEWRHPADKKVYTRTDGTQVAFPIQVAMDPVLGRLAFPEGVLPAQVRVSYAYGFSGDIGGGPYHRSDSVLQKLTRPATWQLAVSQTHPPVPDARVTALAEAVRAWNAQPVGTVGVMMILDSSTYTENLVGDDKLVILEGSQLLIVAADGSRPHLLGNLSVQGNAPGNSPNPGSLMLEGLLVEGALTVLVGNLGSLHIAHSTLVPGKGSLTVNASTMPGKENSQLGIYIQRSICSALNLSDSVPQLSVTDSLLDGSSAGDEDALTIKALGARAEVQRSTIFGRSDVHSLEASNCLFTGSVKAERRQAGCVRFSYLPLAGSQTPRRYRCQPELTLAGRATPAEQDRAETQLKPSFTSRRYSDPGYAQLSQAAAEALRTGAEDGAEMGVFNHLKQPQREANLYASLEEYLRFGLEAGIFYVS